MNFAAVKFGGQSRKFAAKDQSIARAGNPAAAVEYDTKQRPAAWPSTAVGKLGIVGDHGAAARDQGIRTMPQLVNRGSGFLRCDPSRFATPRGDLTVKRHRDFENAERPPLRFICNECFIQAARFLFEYSAFDLDSGLTQHRHPAAIDLRIWILD